MLGENLMGWVGEVKKEEKPKVKTQCKKGRETARPFALRFFFTLCLLLVGPRGARLETNQRKTEDKNAVGQKFCFVR